MENINTVFSAIREAVKQAVTTEKTALTYRKNADGGLLDVIRANKSHLDDAGKSFFLQVYSDELAPALGLKKAKNKTGKISWIGEKPVLSVLKVRKSEVGKLIDAVTDPEWAERDDTLGYHATLSAYRTFLASKKQPSEVTEGEQPETAPVPTKPVENPAIAGINAMFDGIKGPGLRYDETAALLRLIAMRLTDGEGANNNDCAVLAGVLRNVGALVTLNDTAALESLLAPKVAEKRAQVNRAA